eukprot:TRINITY_DN123_c0_g1_i1.p1 TRINITY_DN123_c0_g1~~TRINITY_DN123_c0_g1_i1.p1  ORF type:complete len:320 (+),score=36.85 TRINITY_DN123_c0_g1_i1:506-1465(+)
MEILCWFAWLVYGYFFVSLFTYLVPFLLDTFYFKPQDLKKKYNAEWALVTGGSSGIGRALTEFLAAQGLNIVIVALPDKHLTAIETKLKADYPNQEFRTIGVNLAADDFMDEVIEQTKDIDIQLLFNNAGYITIGFFSDLGLQRQLNNLAVNSVSALKITHHFLNKMLAKELKGCITFTSSPAGIMPTPFSAIYGSSKAFLTEFGQSLAGEVNKAGIDVLVIHPSPVDTAFYQGDTAKHSSSLNLFKKTACAPTTIANAILSAVGRSVVRDQGYFSLSLKLLFKVLDLNLFALLTGKFSHLSSEYKALIKKREEDKKSS